MPSSTYVLVSSLCCAQVLQAMDEYYNEINSNVHRSVHYLSAQSTTAYETARQKVCAAINAQRLSYVFKDTLQPR